MIRSPKPGLAVPSSPEMLVPGVVATTVEEKGHGLLAHTVWQVPESYPVPSITRSWSTSPYSLLLR